MRTNENSLEKFKFDMFLLHQGFRGTEITFFNSVKFPGGGTQSAGFIGWLPYLVSENELSVLLVPYKRKDSQIGKLDDESHFETLLREAKQETGIQANTATLWECFRREAESFNQNDEGPHRQTFYASQISVSDAKNALAFRGYNNNDPEKGRPILVKLRDAYKFLTTAHLDAALHLVKALQNNIDDPLYVQKPFNRGYLLAHLAILQPLLDGELRQRLRRKETKQLAEAN